MRQPESNVTPVTNCCTEEDAYDSYRYGYIITFEVELPRKDAHGKISMRRDMRQKFRARVVGMRRTIPLSTTHEIELWLDSRHLNEVTEVLNAYLLDTTLKATVDFATRKGTAWWSMRAAPDVEFSIKPAPQIVRTGN